MRVWIHCKSLRKRPRCQNLRDEDDAWVFFGLSDGEGIAEVLNIPIREAEAQITSLINGFIEIVGPLPLVAQQEWAEFLSRSLCGWQIGNGLPQQIANALLS